MDGPQDAPASDPRPIGPLRWEGVAVLAAIALVIGLGAWAVVGGEAPATSDAPTNDGANVPFDDGHDHVHGPNGTVLPAEDNGTDGTSETVEEPDSVNTVFASPSPPDVEAIEDPHAVLQACVGEADPLDCYLRYLEARLYEAGSEEAFRLLEEMAGNDTYVDQQSHTLAHLLGRYALHRYGTISETLGTCSYRVFQGCFHGALQEFFETTGALEPETIRALCPPGTPFERYSCVHGLGHGLTLVVHYSMNAALGLCDHLNSSHDRSSCYGGVFMENVVAYMGSKAGGHVHGHDHSYAVDTADMAYPCNDVDTKYQRDCWLMQTSLILYLNGGDFEATVAVCEGLEERLQDVCFRSVGRDASAWRARDAQQVTAICALAPDDGRAACIGGYVAEVVLNYAHPDAGIQRCVQLQDVDKEPCYREVGHQGRSMLGEDGMVAVCDTAEEAYVDTCRVAAGLEARA